MGQECRVGRDSGMSFLVVSKVHVGWAGMRWSLPLLAALQLVYAARRPGGNSIMHAIAYDTTDQPIDSLLSAEKALKTSSNVHHKTPAILSTQIVPNHPPKTLPTMPSILIRYVKWTFPTFAFLRALAFPMTRPHHQLTTKIAISPTRRLNMVSGPYSHLPSRSTKS